MQSNALSATKVSQKKKRNKVHCLSLKNKLAHWKPKRNKDFQSNMRCITLYLYICLIFFAYAFLNLTKFYAPYKCKFYHISWWIHISFTHSITNWQFGTQRVRHFDNNNLQFQQIYCTLNTLSPISSDFWIPHEPPFWRKIWLGYTYPPTSRFPSAPYSWNILTVGDVQPHTLLAMTV